MQDDLHVSSLNCLLRLERFRHCSRKYICGEGLVLEDLGKNWFDLGPFPVVLLQLSGQRVAG